ncbi:bacterioferritin [uncultured Veillonella sp.]|uniref:ferritin-like domain-containing protein n=1 Tax=uncultured Veillonella sp. TaxID=159268 RepID=UPI0025F35A88|nr:ferritin-like domain-containing protein [uncultured Veillonella sp.]MDY3973662.1 ferritin-like domain-containing protein [Veillonella caviae]
MNKREQAAKHFQLLVSALSAGALHHEIHGHIFASQGFSKLGDKYKAHAAEEREFVSKFINRLLDLGVVVEQRAAEPMPVFENFEEYLKHDLDVQQKGMAFLESIVSLDQVDIGSYDILKEYYLDEEEDLNWSQAQVELIEKIGIQNYLVQQI